MTRPVVGHVVRTWLPRSATFVHRAITHQRRVEPVVLTREVRRPVEQPFDPVVEVAPPVRRGRRLARRARALAAGGTVLETELVRAARARRCALLHAHFGTMGAEALPAARRLGAPLVTTFYGYDLALAHPGYAALFGEGARFVVEGPAMAEHLAARGAPRDRIRVVEIGVDIASLPPFALRPLREERFVVLQCARFTEKKGVDLAIAAFARARPALGRDPELWLIGDGPLESRLRERAGEGVRFLGSLPFAQYRERLARADCAIQPSRTASDGDTEGGAPTVLLEYQAAGVPVVATRHADIPYVLAQADLADEEDVDGLAAALVATYDRSPPEREQRALAGRELVERRHDASVTARKLEDVYFELL